jgi:transposase InsO family protein
VSKSVREAVIKVKDQEVKCLLDTGAEVNILGEHTFRRLGKCDLKTPSKKLCAYGSKDELPVLGYFQELVKAPKTKLATVAEIYVMKGETGNLLGCRTAEKLGLVTFVNQVNTKSIEKVVEDYSDRFTGIGKMSQTQVHLSISKDVEPIAQKARRIPFHLRDKVSSEIQRLKDMDIIEDAEGSTPWVSPVVIVKKDKPKKPEDEIRVCIDSRGINTAIERERYPMNTIEDLIVDMNGSKIFSKIDLNKGYHQLELAPESRYITTFATHEGLYRYKRLCFGINSAAEIFQKAIAEMIQGIPGVKNMSDDIIIFSKTHTEHVESVRRVLERLREHNITANREKCQFGVEQIKFFGHVFSSQGISPSDEKIAAIKNASAPKSGDEVRSLLGMAQYVARFCPNYSTIVDPLRKLTKKDTPWCWGDKEENAFQSLKNAMSNWKMVRYFDTKMCTELIVDASPYGLGAILTQKTGNDDQVRVIEYASRALTDTESRYSQTERETLGIVWACEHFNHYLEGSVFVVITDHQPLIGIFRKVTSQPTARIHRLCLRLQPYKFTLEYRPGKNNPADYLSRHLEEEKLVRRITWLDRQTEYVIVNALNSFQNHGKCSISRQELESETAKDECLQKVMQCVGAQKWNDVGDKNDEQFQAYKRICEELSVSDGLVLRGDRVVIPEMLRNRIVATAHASHQGIVKTKALIQETVWFPGIDKLVERAVANCLPCQANDSKMIQNPLKMSPMPKEPWREVAVDFCGPFKTGEYLMVVMDEYSRFPEVEILHSTSAKATIPKLDAIFARQGIPIVVKTDNGPPFNSADFAAWSKFVGFHHRKITPLWPQANGEVERFMRTIAKAVRAAMIEQGSWKQELYTFLRHYRATPHSTTGMSPAEMLNKRKLKTELPLLVKKDVSATLKDRVRLAEEKDTRVKSYMKELADSRRKAEDNTLMIGDKVLVKQSKTDKLSTPFNPSPYEVVTTQGTMITAQRGEHVITRNSSFMKKVPENCGGLSGNGNDASSMDTTAGHMSDNTNNLVDTVPPDIEVNKESPVISKENTPMRRSSRQRQAPKHLKYYVQ